MTEHRLNPALRHAVETSSRRASLATLVGTVFAVTTPGWPRVEAKKKDKTARKRKRKNNRKTNDDADGQCQDQLSPCRDFVDDFCALFNPPGPSRDNCIAQAVVCCEPIAECDGEGFFECLLERIQSI